ncbi:hypothetical protein FF1_045395 [Malus domestica]|uniref:Cell wall protein n=1 Tax=Malus domestica TaxID=3750 RepID=A0A498J8V8_MALDO|nr:putative cell wall protein [Malus sylvestris]RXH89831.1 hypothetical protein DVH24_032188 [Malus domestica]
MAYKTRSSVLTLISISVILLALVGRAVSGRNVPTTSNKDDKKQPQWFLDHDRSFVIPGIGRVMLPPLYNVSPYAPPPSIGSPGGSVGSPSSDDYVPGGDDTYIPNPGYEVPTPGNGGGSPTGAPTP